MNWYLKVFKQYFDFSGRARRKEYWMFHFFNFILSVFAIFTGFSITTEFNVIGFLYLIYLVLSIIPSFAVSVRRMHDIGKSGFMILINMIPLAGPIWFLVLTCMESESRSNKWGPNPKGIGNDSIIDKIGTE